MRTVIAAVAVLCACPPAALAAGSPSAGVHIDPGSPAGKVYALPIPSARGEASGQSSAGSASPPLFGVGVTPSSTLRNSSTKGTGSPRQSASSSSSRSRVTHSRRHRHNGALATPKPPPSTRRPIEAGGIGAGSWVPLVAGGALVLLLGCGGGLVLRRRLTEDAGPAS